MQASANNAPSEYAPYAMYPTQSNPHPRSPQAGLNPFSDPHSAYPPDNGQTAERFPQSMDLAENEPNAAGIGSGSRYYSRTPYDFASPAMASNSPYLMASNGRSDMQALHSEETFDKSSELAREDEVEKYRSLASEPPAQSSWKKWAAILLAVLLIAGAVAGGLAGWKLSQRNSSDSSTTSGSTTAGGDPSKFTKDARLHQSFYGIAYTPKGAMVDQGCNATLSSVIKEIQILSQLTTRIRTYGSDCNASFLVMEAIAQTKVNMSVWLGAYIEMDNDTTTTRQMSDTLAVIKQYRGKNIGGVTVGNEVLLNAKQSAASYQFIADNVASMKSSIQALELGVDIPVGTSDAGSAFTADLSTKIDIYLSNTHPWFGGVNIDDAATWTWTFWQDNNVKISAPTCQTYIGEVGWPSQAMTGSPDNYEGAVASTDNLQKFLDTYVCQANANSTNYFYFEAFDEPWKEKYKGVEPYWGLFDRNYKLKDITIPNCT